MHSVSEEPREMKVTKEEMDKHRLDHSFRDFCAHLLIPLNTCRRATLFVPWKCENERHAYEKCQYEEYLRRLKRVQKKVLSGH